MPLTRYQIRNEYSLADPDLYKAADRDDPEALLEGVAMAGLVGVLRQLGDLAEFAAEIFHDLHEDVMATATRGHGLMVRVQQLEADFPSIEKAILSQTNHSLFFTNAGVGWHPNLCTEQNLITRGDLPRCVMDSYEECRGPPRLFLLDKFDVAGAGACLKRYTDPSFFKVEAAPSEIPSVEIQREKKIRKVKKKGSRWRNGETPEIVPTSHTRLHQLFLEERIEKGHSDPARLVKLKKRHLNASPFDSRSGKSYMEKFLETTPEQKVVLDISVTPLPLKMIPDNCSESGLEMHDVSTASPVKRSSRGNESACTSSDAHDVVLKPSMDELYGEVIDRQIVKILEPSAADERDEIPSSLHKMTIEKEIVVDEEGKTEANVDGDNSDDMTSEVDNYVDALTTMEPEMETDNEYRHKTGLGFSNVEKRMMDSNRDGEKLEFQSHSSDSQSIGNFSASDDGSSSFKKGRSSFSYSDTLSKAENIPSDGEGSARAFSSSEASVTQITVIPSNQLLSEVGLVGTKSNDIVLPNDMSIDEDNTLGEASTNSSLIDSNPPLLALDPVETSLHQKLDETPSETMKPGSEFSHIYERETNLDDSLAAVSDMPSQTRDVTLFTVCAESHPVDKLDAGDPNVSSDDLLHLSNNSELAPEKSSSNDCPDEELQTDFAEENFPENMVNNKIGSPHSITSPTKELVPCTDLPEVEIHSGFTLLTDSSDVGKPDDLVSEVDDAFLVTGVYLENSTSMVDISQNCSFKDQQVSYTVDNVPQGELDLGEKQAFYSKESNLAEISGPVDGEKIGVSTCKVEATEGDAAPFELPYNRTDSSVVEDLGGYDDFVTEGVQAENVNVSSTATHDVPAEASIDDDIDTVVHPSPDIICSPYKDIVNLEESSSGTEDPRMDRLKLNELVSQSCLRGSEAENKMTQLKVAAKDFDSALSNLVSYDASNLKMVQGVHNLSLTEVTQNSLPAGDFTIAAASSKHSGQEMELNCLHHSCFLEDGDNGSSLPTAPFPDVDTSLEQSLQLQTDQLDVEFMKGEATSDSAMHLSEGIQSSDSTNQERLFNNASESCQKYLMNKPSPSECLQQSAGLEINNTNPEMDPLGSVFPSFSLLYEAAQVNLEEIPPLPPLPPMQWRIGKIQHAPQFSRREFFDHSQESCPPIFPFGDHEKGQSGFASQRRGILQPVNPFLPVSAVEVEKLQHVPQREVVNEMQPALSPLQFPSLASDSNCQKNNLALEGTQSLNSLLTLSALPNEKPEPGFLASEHEEVQSCSNPVLSLRGDEDTSSKNGHVSSPDELIQHLNELEPEPALEGKTLQGTPEGNASDTSALPAGKFEEELQPGLPSSESKTLQQTPENSEEERGNSSDTSALTSGKVDQPQHGLPSSEGSLQGCTENSEGECGNPSDTSVQLPGKVEEQPQHDLPSSEGLQSPSENSEGECGTPSDTSVQPPGKIEEQLQRVLPSEEGESVWSSNPFVLVPTSEVGKANGSSMVKLPRPRNPLIDAVAALDKSKLRKVTERVWPQIGPKVDERDSLLEQIRTKSFNLKPALVSRPSIQGPKTNLKVTAILEKANAIRQATAGSDEDDDEDWSDS